MSDLSLGQCPHCVHVLYRRRDGTLPVHMPDGRRNDGGVVPRQPRCEGSGLAVPAIQRMREP